MLLLDIMPSFEILENKTRKRIILEFLKTQKIISYDYIKNITKDDTSRPDYHLNLLVENNLIKRTKGRGNYKLNEIMIQPLRKAFDIKVPICLIGGLGKEISLFVDVIDALQQLSIIPRKYILITSPEIKEQFNSLNFNKDYQIETIVHKLDYQTVLRENYTEIHDLFEKIIKEQIHGFEIICELTGSTKPVSIALMILGERYGLQRIYFSGKKIIWI